MFCKSCLLLLALSFCYSFAQLYHSALLLFYSIILLCFCSSLSLNFMRSIFSFLLSNCFVLFPFRTASPIQSRSFSFIHHSLTIPLPLPMGNPRTSVLATETLTIFHYQSVSLNGFITEALTCEEEQQPSDQYLIQRFRSNRDFTHRDFGICDVKIHKSSDSRFSDS